MCIFSGPIRNVTKAKILMVMLVLACCTPAPPPPVVVTVPEPPRASSTSLPAVSPPAAREGSPAGTPSAAPRPALAPDDDLCPRIGVKECDDYAEEVLMCIMLNAVDATGGELPKLCRQWAQMAATPTGRAAAAARCKSLRASLGRGCR